MVATSRKGQWNVLELSSFQLETIQSFRAHIGACLNITPDHLDRHYTMERYAAAKARLFENQTAEDFAVLNADDPLTRELTKSIAASVVWFSGAQPTLSASDVPLRGRHNLENAMAAASIARLAGAEEKQIRAAIKTFPGVEHRLEFVRETDGVCWYNDSKATNVDATIKAIEAFPGPLWIILGGRDKHSDYAPLVGLLKEKARAALLIGEAAGKIEQPLRGNVPVIGCVTLDMAVREARARARAGDTVLLAPACASFDQFENFEHRGREFKRLVGEL
jgi:UDP-N-acetylmuramoylalanine--D-glutamate ligase